MHGSLAQPRTTTALALGAVTLGTILLTTLAGCSLGSATRIYNGPSAPIDAQQPNSVMFVGLTPISGGAVGDDLFPAPIPDGSGVVFSSDRHSHALKLYLQEEGRTGAIRLTHGTGNDIHAAVSPDGRSLVFASDRDGSWRLYRLDRLDGSAEATALTEPEVTALHPTFDATGARICYMRRSPHGRWEVWIRDLADGSERFVTEGLFPEFHPTKDWMIFQRARKRDARWYSLHVVDLALGRERELYADRDRGAVNPSFHPSGDWIVFNTVRIEAGPEDPAHGDDLYCITDDGDQLVRITETAQAEWNPVWGRDGLIYFTTEENGNAEILRLKPRLPEARRSGNAVLGMGSE